MVAYDNIFFDTIAAGCLLSAETTIPIFLNGRTFDKVVDVGCGQGWWSKVLKEHGSYTIGLDGADTVPADGALDEFIPINLANGVPESLYGSADLAVCLEVAEHLPESSADRLITDLTSLAPTVLFSAAIPFQTGHGHINLQWQSYWAQKFEAKGFYCSWDLRWDVWTNTDVEPWYAQNIIVATSEQSTTSGPCDVVHPTIHYWGR